MNLNMDRKLVDAIATRGLEAGMELSVGRFGPAAAKEESGEVTSNGWDEQRWARLDCSCKRAHGRLPATAVALNGATPHTTPYADLILRHKVAPQATPALSIRSRQRL